MNPTQTRIIAIGILFLLIFLTGFWLSRSGKPYGAIPINIHKLMALADLVLLVIAVYWINRSLPLKPYTLAAAVVAVLLFIATIVSGGLVSILATGGFASVSPSVRSAIPLAHRILPFLTVLSTAATLYLALIRGAV